MRKKISGFGNVITTTSDVYSADKTSNYLQITGHENNFEFIRISSAALVIFGHSYPLHGLGFVPSIAFVGVPTWAVYIFFSLSGYLVGKSFTNSITFKVYLKKRFYRIFPGLTSTILFTILLGGFISSSGLVNYWLRHQWLSYLRNLLLYPVYSISDLFSTNPYPGVINGSIWTIPIEVFCYISIPLMVYKKLRRFSNVVLLIIVFLCGYLSIILPTGENRLVFYGTAIKDGLSVAVYFFGGCFLANISPKFLRFDLALLVMLSNMLLFSIRPSLALHMTWLVLPYVIITFGMAKTPLISRIGNYGDPSYGMYLLGWPIQQAVIYFWPQLSHLASVILVFLIVIPLSYISWWGLEKPLLKKGTS
jgi:peptidoglycan/LPS O-acetylase OafA/YrhL